MEMGNIINEFSEYFIICCLCLGCSLLLHLQVRVQKRSKPELVLSLSVPIEAADNADAVRAFNERRRQLEAAGQKMFSSLLFHY